MTRTKKEGRFENFLITNFGDVNIQRDPLLSVSLEMEEGERTRGKRREIKVLLETKNTRF